MCAKSAFNIRTRELRVDGPILKMLERRFVAFDVETTGFSPQRDRIIELGAVIFEEGKPVGEFNTLVNPGMHISSGASAVNHITDDMVTNAPKDAKAVQLLQDFMDTALEGRTIVVAHNARFDISFLEAMLRRTGTSAQIEYVDTLSLARRRVWNVSNYKQPTLARHFRIPTGREHRATDDARTCGYILSKLLEFAAVTATDNRRSLHLSHPM